MRLPGQRVRLSALGCAAALAAWLPAVGSLAQPRGVGAEIWRLEMGTPVAELPAQYLDPHCGTNGGPPSLRLDGWQDFARCPREADTGLREIWFTEDDEVEYVALAYRTRGFEPGPGAANVLLMHKMIYSLLVDDEGRIQGYRAFTDPREPAAIRADADFVGDGLRGLYGYGAFECRNLPPAEDETSIQGRLVKQLCEAEIDGRRIRIERRAFRKPGQTAVDPVLGVATEGEFDSATRVEVLAVERLAPGAALPGGAQ